jgi:transposase
VSKQYRPWAPDQSFLLPPSPTEWLPEGHLAYFVLDLVSELDLREIEAVIHAKDPRGTRPYSPRMMTALIVYAYCVGVFSSRKIEKATYEDVAFRVIAGGEHPFFTTVNDFRLEHRRALSGLFLQVLKLCGRAGLKTLGHVSLDGSKVLANASKHKAMSYGRMKEEEKRLQAEIEGLMQRAEEVDARENAEHGPDKRGDEVEEELRYREGRLRRIREAKEALEEEAKAARAAELREQAAGQRATAAATDDATERRRATTRAKLRDDKADEIAPRNDDDDDSNGPGASLPLHRVATTTDAKPTDKAQRNFTDPDSRIMVRNGVFLQAYNAQAAVSEDQIIVAHGVTNAPTDTEQLEPMLERVRANCGELSEVFTADSGYSSERNMAFCEANGVDAYIAVQRFASDDSFPPTTSAHHARFAMRVKLASDRGKAIYALRKTLTEPVFGQIKQAMGFRRFSLRGLDKVPDEWGIVSLCHNVLKLFRRLAATTTLRELRA